MTSASLSPLIFAGGYMEDLGSKSTTATLRNIYSQQEGGISPSFHGMQATGLSTRMAKQWAQTRARRGRREPLTFRKDGREAGWP